MIHDIECECIECKSYNERFPWVLGLVAVGITAWVLIELATR